MNVSKLEGVAGPVRIDTDSDETVTLNRYPSIELAHAFVRACLPNLGDLT
jgi:hypothetical protein